MISQEDFNTFVKDYNEDYMMLLRRAGQRHYDCLISSFMVLKDLYNVIQVLFDTGSYTYEVLPYPFSFQADVVLLKRLGFDDDQVKNIFGFLDHVKQTQGMDFEACLESGSLITCPQAR